MAPPQTDLRIVPAGEAAPPVQGNVGGRSVTVYESPYACLVSTLTENEEGPYLYGAFFLHFPPGIERTANGEKEAAIFTLRDRDAPDHAGNGGSGDGIVRMARCVFPASDAARNMLRRKLAQFGPESWVATRMPGGTEGNENQDPPQPHENDKNMCHIAVHHLTWSCVHVR